MLQMSSGLKSDGFVATATVPKKIFSTKSARMHILSNLLKFTCNVSVGVRPGTEWSRYQLTKANIAPSPSRYLPSNSAHYKHWDCGCYIMYDLWTLIRIRVKVYVKYNNCIFYFAPLHMMFVQWSLILLTLKLDMWCSMLCNVKRVLDDNRYCKYCSLQTAPLNLSQG